MSFETNIRALQRAVQRAEGSCALCPDGVIVDLRKGKQRFVRIVPWHDLALWRFPSLATSFVTQMERALR
jgi:hypothetical protein